MRGGGKGLEEPVFGDGEGDRFGVFTTVLGHRGGGGEGEEEREYKSVLHFCLIASKQVFKERSEEHSSRDSGRKREKRRR